MVTITISDYAIGSKLLAKLKALTEEWKEDIFYM